MLHFLSRYYKELNHCIYHLIIITGIILGLVKFKKLTTGSRIFLLLLIITPLEELAGFYCAVQYHNNHFIYDPFNLLQFTLICWAFYSESRSKAIWIVFAVFIFSAGINAAFFQPFLRSSNSNTLMVEYLLVIVLYFMYLVSYFKRTEEGSLKAYPLFWIGLGWLLFSIASIVAFGFSNLVTDGTYWDEVSDWVRRISNYLLYLSFFIGFLSAQKSLNDIPERK
jgi:hypothetical protein